MINITIKDTHLSVIHDLLNRYLSIYWFNIEYYKKINDPGYKNNHGFSIEDKLRFATEEYNKIKYNITIHEKLLEEGNKTIEFQSHSNIVISLKSLIKENYNEYIGWLSHNNHIALDRLKRAIRLLDLLRQIDDRFICVNVRYFSTI